MLSSGRCPLASEGIEAAKSEDRDQGTAAFVSASDAIALSQHLAQTRSWVRLAGVFYCGMVLADLLATARGYWAGPLGKGGSWLLPAASAALLGYLLLTGANVELRGSSREALPRLAQALHRNHRLWVGWALATALKAFLS